MRPTIMVAVLLMNLSASGCARGLSGATRPPTLPPPSGFSAQAIYHHELAEAVGGGVGIWPHRWPHGGSPPLPLIPGRGRTSLEIFQMADPPCEAIGSLMTDEEALAAPLEIMERRNIVAAVTSGPPGFRWREAAPE